MIFFIPPPLVVATFGGGCGGATVDDSWRLSKAAILSATAKSALLEESGIQAKSFLCIFENILVYKSVFM